MPTCYAGACDCDGPLNLDTQLMARPSEAVALLDEPCVAAAPLVVDAPLAARCAGCAPACAGSCGCAGSLDLDIRLIAQSGAVGCRCQSSTT